VIPGHGWTDGCGLNIRHPLMLQRTYNKEINGNKKLCLKLVLQNGLVVPPSASTHAVV